MLESVKTPKGKRTVLSDAEIKPDVSAQSDLPDLTDPEQFEIPEIKGEMLRLRPAVWSDCDALDKLDAFSEAASVTGKSCESERAIARAWIARSVAISNGEAIKDRFFADPESRGVMAWAMVADPTVSDPAQASDDSVIGMIFLVDIDPAARNARMQVILGRNYRGRGYSRDAMPRVMTFGLSTSAGCLGLERIWVAVPESNSRSLTVYQSLGFVSEGVSRHALWDEENNKFQDLNVIGILADEFDPVHSLEAFGLRPIEENPGAVDMLDGRRPGRGRNRKFSPQNRAVRSAVSSAAAPNYEKQGSASGSASVNSAANNSAAVNNADKNSQTANYVGNIGNADSTNKAGRANNADSSVHPDNSVRSDIRRSAVYDGSKAYDRSYAQTDTDSFAAYMRPGDTVSPDQTILKHSETGSSGSSAGDSSHTEWAYGESKSKNNASGGAWWRNLGRNRKRESVSSDSRKQKGGR